MQKTLLTSVIVLALSACDSGEGVRLAADGSVIDSNGNIITTDATGGTNTGDDNTVVGTESGGTGNNTDGSGSTGGNGSTDSGNGTGTGTGSNGSGSGDNGSTESGGTNNDGSNGDSTGSNGGSDSSDDDDKDHAGDDETDTDVKPDDDSGSSTSDGGEVNDDSGSATSDGGEVNDDSGSATSDGGEVNDDSGSATSDGGSNDDSGSSTSDGGETTSDNGGSNNGGSFESDQVGGSVLRVSSLASTAERNICTSLNEQNNFSDTRVGDFILHNNAWRPWRAFPDYQWEQCIYTNTNGALAGWYYDWGPGREGVNGATSASGDYYVRSYPELIYGVKDEFRTSAPQSETGLPVRLGDMPNISIDYSYSGPQYGEGRTVDASNNPRFPNGTNINGERNVAIESFLYQPNSEGVCSTDIVKRNGGSNHTYEIMVWLDAGAERLPAGPSDFVTDVSIRGADFKVYTKAADPRYVAFVAQNPQTSGQLIWNDFTDWASTYAHRVEQEFGARSNSDQIQQDWCVANIIVGTEIFWGSGNLDIYDWTITQRQP